MKAPEIRRRTSSDLREEVKRLRRAADRTGRFDEIRGTSAAMETLMMANLRRSPYRSSVSM